MWLGAEVTRGRGDSGAEVTGAEVSGAEVVGLCQWKRNITSSPKGNDRSPESNVSSQSVTKPYAAFPPPRWCYT